MVADELGFLEERLSAFRGEYIGQLDKNVPKLLPAFDRVVLGGYSLDKENQLRGHPSYARVTTDSRILQGQEDINVYEALTSHLSTLQGESREAFLYGLRAALLRGKGAFENQENKTARAAQWVDSLLEDGRRIQDPGIGLLLSTEHFQIQELRGVSSGYRDIYKVMVDVVKQALK